MVNNYQKAESVFHTVKIFQKST